MVRAGLLSYAGGLALTVLILSAAILLNRCGVSVSEALYLSALGLTATSYGITAWHLRRGRTR